MASCSVVSAIPIADDVLDPAVEVLTLREVADRVGRWATAVPRRVCSDERKSDEGRRHPTVGITGRTSPR
ncbi:hypothetical protein ACFQ1S_43855, partial [Kibdelosporangium lantanae]